MALVNPNIAMGFRQPEIQVPNALAQYAQIQQIQGGRQAQELNALKMQEYERARTEEEGLRNYLAQADVAKPETRANLLRYGKTGLAYGKALSEQDTAALTQQKARQNCLMPNSSNHAAFWTRLILPPLTRLNAILRGMRPTTAIQSLVRR